MKQTRLAGTNPLKNRGCPACGKKLDNKPLAVPGETKNYCSLNCIIAKKL